jgi:hypothetical protein
MSGVVCYVLSSVAPGQMLDTSQACPYETIYLKFLTEKDIVCANSVKRS